MGYSTVVNTGGLVLLLGNLLVTCSVVPGPVWKFGCKCSAEKTSSTPCDGTGFDLRWL